MKRYILEEAQAGPDSNKLIGQEMRVMRTIILRSKRLHPWHVVEVHAVVVAMGGRNMLPKRVG